MACMLLQADWGAEKCDVGCCDRNLGELDVENGVHISDGEVDDLLCGAKGEHGGQRTEKRDRGMQRGESRSLEWQDGLRQVVKAIVELGGGRGVEAAGHRPTLPGAVALLTLPPRNDDCSTTSLPSSRHNTEN